MATGVPANQTALWDADSVLFDIPLRSGRTHRCLYILADGNQCGKQIGKETRWQLVQLLNTLSQQPLQQINSTVVAGSVADLSLCTYMKADSSDGSNGKIETGHRGLDTWEQVVKALETRLEKHMRNSTTAMTLEGVLQLGSTVIKYGTPIVGAIAAYHHEGPKAAFESVFQGFQKR